MAIVEGQKVEICWTNNNRLHFESRGYKFTNYRDKILVNVVDLMLNSSAIVSYICDECGKEDSKKFSLISNKEGHYCSKQCANKNRSTRKNTKSLEDSLEGLLSLCFKLGKCPTVTEYDQFALSNDLMIRRTLEKKLNMNWVSICEEYCGKSNQRSMSEGEFINRLIEIKSTLGRTPMVTELKDYGLNFKQIYRIYNMRYSDLIKSLEWELSGHDVIMKSDDELLEDFVVLYHKLGRIPSYDDIDREDIANSQTYRKRIGNIFDICDLCEIDYKCNLSDLNISSGFVSLDKNNDICLSYPEMIISNIFIDCNVNYEKEFKYCNLIECDPRMRADWYLNDLKILVEYFGLYKEKDLGKNTRIGRYSNKVLNKINMCKENDLKLIALYPEDLRNNLKGVKEKLASYINNL